MTPKAFYINLSQASVLLPVITGLLYYRNLTRSYRILFYFFVASVGFEVAAEIMKYVLQNNIPALHLFTLAEFLALSMVFYHHFQKNSILRLFIGINAIVFVGAALADALFINSIWTWNTLSRSYSSVTMICYALVYFLFLFRHETPEYSVGHPMFWVSTGVLFYFGTNMLYFLLHDYLVRRSYNTAITSILTHAMINIITYSVYAQSFRCFRTPRQAL